MRIEFPLLILFIQGVGHWGTGCFKTTGIIGKKKKKTIKTRRVTIIELGRFENDVKLIYSILQEPRIAYTFARRILLILRFRLSTYDRVLFKKSAVFEMYGYNNYFSPIPLNVLLKYNHRFWQKETIWNDQCDCLIHLFAG